MNFWKKPALFSPPAVGSQQRAANEIHRRKNRRRQEERKNFILLQNAGCKPARVLSVSGKQKSTVEIPTACRNHAGNLQWGHSKLLGAGCATIVLKTPYRNLLWKRKNSFDVISSVKGASKKRPWQKYTFCQGRTKYLSAVPPWFTAWPVHLAGYLHIPGKWRLPATSQNTQHMHQTISGTSLLTAPSAVHLTMCFLPEFHHLRLSVKAS